MKIIYAKKSSGIDEQGSFQNPEYYLKPESNAQSVVIYGDYPHIKADYEELGVDVEVRELPKAKPLTIDVKVSITPELQATIDQAKAECEKVIAENVELKKQVEDLQVDLVSSRAEFTESAQESVPVAIFNELKAERDTLAAQVKDLEAKAKKPTASEAKAAKAAEETAKAEPPKE